MTPLVEDIEMDTLMVDYLTVNTVSTPGQGIAD